MENSGRREHLIETAIKLFCEHGFHATGIDKILETAGISKRTMYLHFRSKEELIYAALRQYDSVFRNKFMKAVEARAQSPQEKLLAIFDVAEAWFRENNFFGCMFINAIGEYSEKNSPMRDICKQFKQQMWNYVDDLAKQTGAKSHQGLADSIFILFEGATVTAQVSEKPEAATTAKQMARELIKNFTE